MATDPQQPDDRAVEAATAEAYDAVMPFRWALLEGKTRDVFIALASRDRPKREIALLPGRNQMSNPEPMDLERLKAAPTVEEIIKALEPFAEAADETEIMDEDRWEIWETPAAMSITVGDLRRARELLTRLSSDTHVLAPKEPSEETIEAIARAICDEEWDGSQPSFDRKPAGFGARYRNYARAAYRALASTGGEK